MKIGRTGYGNITRLVLCLAVSAALLFMQAAVASGEGPGVPFDAELYETGYVVYLMNGHVEDALSTAEAALEARGNDSVWRRRAAECAEMAGAPEKALRHWLCLDDEAARHHALNLATQLGDARSALTLLQCKLSREKDPGTVRAYVDTAVKLGDIQRAVSFLEKIATGTYREYALERLSHLHEAMGRPDKAIEDLLALAAERPLPSGETHRLARLRYGRGDLIGGYRTLKEGRAVAENDPDYLHDLSDICWIMQDLDCSAETATRLMAMDKARAVDYRRVIFYLRHSDPEGALRAARAGATRFGAVPFFNDMAIAGQWAGNWQELDRFVSALSPAERRILEKRADYWLLLSKIAMHLGRSDQALSCCRRALALRPEDSALVASCLWMLMDGDQYDGVREFTRRYRNIALAAPEAIDALAAASVYLGEYGAALRLYRQRLAARQNDPLWLISYADVLDQNNRRHAAFGYRMHALSLVRSGLKKYRGNTAARQELELSLTRLMLCFQKGDALDARMMKIASRANDATKRELVVAWALSSARSDFARRWLLRAYVRDRAAPLWAQLGLALEENDRQKIARLLRDHPGRLPYRDAIEGAQRIGATPLAEEMAWNRSRENPADYLVQRQVRELFSAHPARIAYRFRTMDLAGVGAIENGVFCARPVSPRYALSAETNYSRYSTRRSGVVNVPDGGDFSVLLGVKRRFEKGQGLFRVGWRSALEDFPVLDTSFSWRPAPRLSIEGELGYSVRAEESIPLRIGGMKDLATLRLSWSPTARETLQASVSHALFRDQQRKSLGNGSSISLDVSHALTFAYPDFRIRGFVGYYDYTAKGRLSGSARSLVPCGAVADTSFGVPESFARGRRSGSARSQVASGAVADASFYVPESFFQIGVGAGVGQGYQSGYTENWKAFGSADMNWRTSIGFGFDLGIGARGPLFGNDTLGLRLLLSRGTSATSDFSGTLNVEYSYYLN